MVLKVPLRGERNSRPRHPAERRSGAGGVPGRGGYGARGRPPVMKINLYRREFIW